MRGSFLGTTHGASATVYQLARVLQRMSTSGQHRAWPRRCFRGLQDIEIEFGAEGAQQTVAEAVRVLRHGGVLTLLDELSSERFEALLQGLPVAATELGARVLDIRWSREVAEHAAGWAIQTRYEDRLMLQQVREEAQCRMAAEMERQFADQGYYVPFGPVHMIVARKVGEAPKSTAIGSA